MSEGLDINCRTVDSATCAHMACDSANDPIILRLKELSPTLFNEFDSNGYNSLHLAALRGHDTVCKLLITNIGMDPVSLTAGGKTVKELLTEKEWEMVRSVFQKYFEVEKHDVV